MRKGKSSIWIGLAFAAMTHGQESYSQWAHYKDITVNTTATGANVANAVANFPLAIRLSAADSAVFTQAAGGGADIRFTGSDGSARLKHQKESWDSAGRNAAFWVLAPSIAGNANTVLRIYWGKSGAADSSSGAAVFDTTNAFRAVWHMNGGTGNENDATLNGFTMTASTSAPTHNASGAIGPARTFDGNSQYLVASAPLTVSGNLDIRTGTPRTVSAWVYASMINTSSTSGNSIVNKGDRNWNLQIYANTWESATYVSNNTWRQVQSTGAPAEGAWHYIAGTWAGGTSGNVAAQIYVNGMLDNTSNQASGNSQVTTYNVFIGVNPSSGSNSATPGSPTTAPTNSDPRYWNGHLDEITVSSTVRSADWIKLAYETQRLNGTAVTGVGAPVGVFQSRVRSSGFAIHSTGSSFVFRIPSGAASVRVSVLDAWGREVWNRTVSSRERPLDLTWNGRSVNGTKLSSGVYVARVMLRDDRGAEAAVAQRTISLMP